MNTQAEAIMEHKADTQGETAVISELYKAIETGNDLEKENALWNALLVFQNRSFKTAKGLEYSYYIKGYEMFVDRKEKSITRSTINIAFHKALELGAAATGPKKLGTFGASYLYPIFLQIGVVKVS